jgi:hypothetical protein
LGRISAISGTKRICARRLSYTTWTLDIKAPGFGRATVAELARYYVGLTQAWTHKDAAIRVEPPARDSTRKGDFGELSPRLFRAAPVGCQKSAWPVSCCYDQADCAA